MEVGVDVLGRGRLGPLRCGLGVVGNLEGAGFLLVSRAAPPGERVPVGNVFLHQHLATFGDDGAAEDEVVAATLVTHLCLECASRAPGRAGSLVSSPGFGVTGLVPECKVLVAAAGVDAAISGHVPLFGAAL